MLTGSSKNIFRLQLMYTDRQLWALGAIVAQWAVLEKIVDQHARAIVAESDLTTYDATRAFSRRKDIWKNAVKQRLTEPHKTEYLTLISRIGELQDIRDTYVHGIPGGVREPHKETRHAGFVKNISHVKSATKNIPAEFSKMKKLAIEISEVTLKIMFTENDLKAAANTSNLRDAFKLIESK